LAFYETVSIRYGNEPYKGNFAWALARHFLEDNGLANSRLTADVFGFLTSAIGEMGMFLRELVFEEVRRDKYPGLPSRRKCTFLCNEQTVTYWGGWFGDIPASRALFEVSCTGKIHEGHQGHLDSDSMNYAEYVKNALAYWSGEDTKEPTPTEIIFEGKMEILRLVSMSKSVNTVAN
jgi:hypothetical protein